MIEPFGHQKFIRCAPLWATASRMNQARLPSGNQPATPAAAETVGHEHKAERCRPWQPSSRPVGAIYTEYYLARIIHERFYCNRGFAATTHLAACFTAPKRAGSPLGRLTSCSRMPPFLAGSALKPASPTLTRGPSPLVKSPRRGHTPFETPRRRVTPPPGSARPSRWATPRFRDEPS